MAGFYIPNTEQGKWSKVCAVFNGTDEDKNIAVERKKIDEAGKSLDEARHRNDIIQKKLKGVEALETGVAGEVLELTEYTE